MNHFWINPSVRNIKDCKFRAKYSADTKKSNAGSLNQRKYWKNVL